MEIIIYLKIKILIFNVHLVMKPVVVTKILHEARNLVTKQVAIARIL